MKEETAYAIQNAANEDGVELDLRDSYSGRGMYGKTTFAIVADSHGKLFGAIAYAASEMEPGSDEASDFCDDCRGFRIDSLGRGIVVY